MTGHHHLKQDVAGLVRIGRVLDWLSFGLADLVGLY